MKFNLILPIAFLLLIFSQVSYSQDAAADLRVSIDIGKNVFNLMPHRKFRVRLENKTGATIKFESKNAKLGLSPAGKSETPYGGYFAFIKINADKIKHGETIEIETQLDELHWYPSTASYYAHSEEPNLKDISRIFPGKYQVAAGVERKLKDETKSPTSYSAYSESINITLN